MSSRNIVPARRWAYGILRSPAVPRADTVKPSVSRYHAICRSRLLTESATKGPGAVPSNGAIAVGFACASTAAALKRRSKVKRWQWNIRELRPLQHIQDSLG